MDRSAHGVFRCVHEEYGKSRALCDTGHLLVCKETKDRAFLPFWPCLSALPVLRTPVLALCVFVSVCPCGACHVKAAARARTDGLCGFALCAFGGGGGNINARIIPTPAPHVPRPVSRAKQAPFRYAIVLRYTSIKATSIRCRKTGTGKNTLELPGRTKETLGLFRASLQKSRKRKPTAI